MGFVKEPTGEFFWGGGHMGEKPRTKSLVRTKRPKKRAKFSYDQLLKLADKMRPPQRWFDEQTNPFEPKPGA